MKTKIFLICCTFLFLADTARSQDSKLSLNLNYNYSFPVNSFKSDVFPASSARGFTGNLMYQVNPALNVGLGFGYQDYYDKQPRQVYDLGDNQHVSAVLTNSMQITPFLARAEWLPFNQTLTAIQPYVSLGAGVNLVDYAQYLGEFPSSATKAGFRLQGGLGVKVPVWQARGLGVDVGGAYDYSPFHHYGLKNLNTLNVHGGIYFAF